MWVVLQERVLHQCTIGMLQRSGRLSRKDARELVEGWL
jgi:hypothetical protein